MTGNINAKIDLTRSAAIFNVKTTRSNVPTRAFVYTWNGNVTEKSTVRTVRTKQIARILVLTTVSGAKTVFVSTNIGGATGKTIAMTDPTNKIVFRTFVRREGSDVKITDVYRSVLCATVRINVGTVATKTNIFVGGTVFVQLRNFLVNKATAASTSLCVVTDLKIAKTDQMKRNAKRPPVNGTVVRKFASKSNRIERFVNVCRDTDTRATDNVKL